MKNLSAGVILVVGGAAAVLLGHEDDEEEGAHGAHPAPEPQYSPCTSAISTAKMDYKCLQN